MFLYMNMTKIKGAEAPFFYSDLRSVTTPHAIAA